MALHRHRSVLCHSRTPAQEDSGIKDKQLEHESIIDNDTTNIEVFFEEARKACLDKQVIFDLSKRYGFVPSSRSPNSSGKQSKN